jgi:hypothetical protein
MHPNPKPAIIKLYRAMPGAPQPSRDEDGCAMWGDVEGNEHWQFCEAIVNLIESQIDRFIPILR